MNVLFEGNTKTGTDEWLTPPSILKKLGEFDLDPCSPINRPWNTANNHYNINDDGLQKKWFGRVWCNPPYDNILQWLRKCSKYGNCIALVFARTETEAFQKYVFPQAYALFFIYGRLKFYRVDGSKSGNAGAPSVLIAYNKENAEILKNSELIGKYISLKQTEPHT